MFSGIASIGASRVPIYTESSDMEGLQIFAHGAILCPNWTHLYTVSLWESWHEFPIDLLYKDVTSLDTKWRILASCPNSQYTGTLGARGVECPLWQWKNCLKLGKRGKKIGKKRKNQEKIEKKRKNREERTKIAPPDKWGWLRYCICFCWVLTQCTLYACMLMHVCIF